MIPRKLGECEARPGLDCITETEALELNSRKRYESRYEKLCFELYSDNNEEIFCEMLNESSSSEGKTRLADQDNNIKKVFEHAFRQILNSLIPKHINSILKLLCIKYKTGL